MIGRAVRLAKKLGLCVRFTCEDASRTELELVIQVFEIALAAGADRISYADTVGVAIPSEITTVVRQLVDRFGQVVHVHCHNDLGLAVANSLAAFEVGALGIDVSIEGVGERSGIAALEQVVCVLHARYDIGQKWNISLLHQLSQQLHGTVDCGTIDTRPIVGGNAFAHRSGLHIAAQLAHKRSYEAIAPETLGRKRKFVLSDLVGKEAVRSLLEKTGLDIEPDVSAKLRDIIKREPTLIGTNTEVFFVSSERWTRFPL